MPWSLYKNWSGGVSKHRIRVQATKPSGVTVYGLSMNPLCLRPGAVGIITNILPDGASLPSYVRFKGPINVTYAAEVLVKKSENSEVIWKDLRTALMHPDETVILIPRKAMDELEIEY